MTRIDITRDIATCLAIRKAVFTDEQGIAQADDADGLDTEAVQFLQFCDEIAIGTARMLIDGDKGKIGRVAVLKSHRGQGYGAALVQAAVTEASRLGLAKVELGSRADAITFYQRLGFAPEGETFLDVGIPHQMMVRAL